MSKKKGKGAKDWLDPQAAAEYAATIDATEGLPRDDLLSLLRADQPPCDVKNRCSGSKKDTPQCFCKLIPIPGRFKKKGLWQKEASALSSLGSDPSGSKREVDYYVRFHYWHAALNMR